MSLSADSSAGRLARARPAGAEAHAEILRGKCVKDAGNCVDDGFATLEPHLLGGGPTGGVTGTELFPKAVAAFKAILDRAGARYQ